MTHPAATMPGPTAARFTEEENAMEHNVVKRSMLEAALHSIQCSQDPRPCTMDRTGVGTQEYWLALQLFTTSSSVTLILTPPRILLKILVQEEASLQPLALGS